MPKMSVCKWNGEQCIQGKRTYDKKHKCYCGLTFRHQSSLSTHKNIKHGQSRNNKPRNLNKRKQRQAGIILKNDVQFNDREVDLQKLPEDSYLIFLKQVNAVNLDQRIKQMISWSQGEDNTNELIDFQSWADSKHRRCRQKVKELAREQQLQQIIGLVFESDLCKNTLIDNFEVNMVWDLAKHFSNLSSTAIYLDILCHIAQTHIQKITKGPLRDAIDQYRAKIYGVHQQIINNLLRGYCIRWTTMFNSKPTIRRSRRKGTTKMIDV